MSLIIILVSLALQYYAIGSQAYQYDWMTPYYTWLHKRFDLITKGHGLLALVMVILPILIVTALLFAIIYHGLTVVGYFVISVVLLWYCLDTRDWQESHVATDQVVERSYSGVFARIFWFGLLGPVGLLLYVSVEKLIATLATQGMSRDTSTLLHHATLVQELLDWIPLRLLGIAFALVGNFADVFKSWIKNVLGPISNNRGLLVEWSKLALHNSETGQGVTPIIHLLNRALLIWLVAMALISIGIWIG